MVGNKTDVAEPTMDMPTPRDLYQQNPPLPLLEVDINITPENSKRIQIYENDIIEGNNGVAHRFCIQNNLGQEMEE